MKIIKSKRIFYHDEFIRYFDTFQQPDTLDICSEVPRYNSISTEKSLRRTSKSQYIREDKALTWDNGRDWRKASKKEGSWIRICPLWQQQSESTRLSDGISEAPKYIEKEIKSTVVCVQK